MSSLKSLLEEIQREAVGQNVKVATLLRKCKILAFKLGNSQFKQWVENELNGYKSIDKLPDYRIISVISKGIFLGEFGYQFRNADIPLSIIPEEFREHFQCHYSLKSTAYIENLVEESKKQVGAALREQWEADAARIVGSNVFEGMVCLQAWKVIPTSSLVDLLESIRNRILSFVLKMEEKIPTVEEPSAASSTVMQEQVRQIFNMTINGNVQNVATGNEDVTQKAIYKAHEPNDLFGKLLQVISESNTDKEVISVLVNVVNEMRTNQGTSSFTPSYQKFMESLANHAQVFSVVAPFIPALSALLPNL